MNLARIPGILFALSLGGALPSMSATITAAYSSASSIPVTASSFTATGNDVALSLGFAPPVGTNLTVVKNTGLSFISGQFSNLAHGQTVNLFYGGKSYRFVANYYGGSGNDLVLHWAYQNMATWGSDQFGQLGDDTSTSSSVLVDQSGVLAGKNAVAIAAGGNHNLVLCSDGTLAAWGNNGSGQLGDGTTTNRKVPVLVNRSGVLAGKTVVAIAAGNSHNLVLCSDGTLAAWGHNFFGALGDGTTTGRTVPVLVDRSGVLAGKTVVAIAAATYRSLVLCSDGTLAAWGWNEYGQLGDGMTNNGLVPVLVNRSGVLAGKTVVAITVGDMHSIVLCSDGTLAAWGCNSGILGDGTMTDRMVPVLVDQSGVLAGKTVIAIAAGSGHNLVLCSDGTLAAWGNNLGSQLGDGTTTDRLVPVLVDQSGVLAGKTVNGIAAGYGHSFALCSEGILVAWGYSFSGQFGDGTTTTRKIATPALVTQSDVLAGRTVKSIAAGESHTHALCTDGTLVAWGENHYGQLGNGMTTDPMAKTPVLANQSGALAGKTVVKVSAGDLHNLALCSDGILASWGAGQRIGDGVEYASRVPNLVNQSGVLAGKTVVEAMAGGSHSLVLCSDGTLASWGYNHTGILGDGTTTDRMVPVLVDQSGVLAGKTVVAIAAGGNHNLVLCSDGTLAAWGENQYGQLGDGTTTDRMVPVMVNRSGVLAGKTVVAVSAGNWHSLALCSDGTLAAWGNGEYCQLGDGTTTNRMVPVLVNRSGVLAGKTVVAISVGSFHNLVLCSDGTLAAWGNNGSGNLSGQLGDGTTTDRKVPVLVNRSGVLAGKTVVAISAGGLHNLVLCSDGTLAAWGENTSGQLGDGTTTNRWVPVLVNQSGVLAGKTVENIAAGGWCS